MSTLLANVTPPCPLPLQEKSARDIEMEQEAKLMAKYGGLKPKTKLLPKVSRSVHSAMS